MVIPITGLITMAIIQGTDSTIHILITTMVIMDTEDTILAIGMVTTMVIITATIPSAIIGFIMDVDIQEHLIPIMEGATVQA